MRNLVVDVPVENDHIGFGCTRTFHHAPQAEHVKQIKRSAYECEIPSAGIFFILLYGEPRLAHPFFASPDLSRNALTHAREKHHNFPQSQGPNPQSPPPP